jgi:hypothetical protein
MYFGIRVGWRKLRNEGEVHDCYFSPHIIRVIKSWAEHEACMGKKAKFVLLVG